MWMIAAGCGAAPDEARVQIVDLVRLLPQAVARPEGGRFAVAASDVNGVLTPVLTVPPSSRLTWTFDALPRRGFLSAMAGVDPSGGPATIAFRVGISDGRTYETLAEETVSTAGSTQGWMPMRVDLSRYAGPQWSVFYRPDERRWELILGSHALEGAPAAAHWAAPGIETDRDAARRFHQRRAAARR